MNKILRALATSVSKQSLHHRFSLNGARRGFASGVTLNKDYLRLHLGEDHFDFHYRFLRHNCHNCSAGCLHPQTKERLIDPCELSIHQYTPKAARTVTPEKEESSLEIQWSDGHQSRFPFSFLIQFGYSRNRLENVPANLPHNNADITLAWNDRTPERIHSILTKHRFLVVTGGPKTPEGTFEIIDEQFGGREFIIPTHFGLVEDLMVGNTTNKNTDQLGYTNEAVELHTDQPFITNAPNMQMLHCIQPAPKGGESSVADAAAAARYLRVHDPLAFWLLQSVPIRFHRKQNKFESLVVAPLLQLDGNFELEMIRYSYFTMDPMHAPFEIMEKWYDAYIKFTKLIRDPQNHYSCALKSGDYLIYNNHTMLHARTAFSGSRHFRGIYLDWNQLNVHLIKKIAAGNKF